MAAERGRYIEYVKPSWRCGMSDRLELYDAELAYRMQPLKPHTNVMAYMNEMQPPPHAPRHVSISESLDLMKAGNHLGTRIEEKPKSEAIQHLPDVFPLTCSESRTCSLAVGAELFGHEAGINSLVLDDTEGLLLSASDDCTLSLYSTSEWKLLQSCRTMHRAAIMSAAFLAGDTRRVISCGLDGRTILTDLETGHPYHKCRMFFKATSLVTSPWWPDVAYVAYTHGVIARVDTRERYSMNEFPFTVSPREGEVINVNTLVAHERWPFLIASGTNTPNIYLHDIRMNLHRAYALLTIPNLSNKTRSIGGLAFSDRGDWMAVNYYREDVYTFSWLDALYSSSIPGDGNDDYVESDNFPMLFHIGRRHVPSIPIQNAIRLHGRENVSSLFKNVTFMEDDSIVCTGGDDGSVYFWRRDDGTQLHFTPGDSQEVRVVRYCHNAGKLLSAGADASVKVLEPSRSVRAGIQRTQPLCVPPSFQESSSNRIAVGTIRAGIGARNSLLPTLGINTSNDEPETNINFSSVSSLPSSSFPPPSSSSSSLDHASFLHEEESELSLDEDFLNKSFILYARRKISGRSMLTQFNAVLNLQENAPLADLILATKKIKDASELVENALSQLFCEDEESLYMLSRPFLFGLDSLEDLNVSGESETPLSHEEYGSNRVKRNNENATRGEDDLDIQFAQDTVMNQTIRSELCKKMFGAVEKLLAYVRCAFSQWTVPKVGAAQIPHWSTCTWGIAALVPTPLDDDWLMNTLNKPIGSSFGVQGRENHMNWQDANHVLSTVDSVDVAASRGRLRVRCLLYIMDIVLHKNRFLLHTIEDVQSYWRFCAGLELNYVYYYMALGDRERALDRVTGLERHAEYRCVTELGAVESACMEKQRSCCGLPMIIRMLRALDVDAFPPLLIPLALRIRILVLSSNTTSATIVPIVDPVGGDDAVTTSFFAGGSGEEQGEEEDEWQNEGCGGADVIDDNTQRISVLTREMRNRLCGHSNVVLSEQVRRMLHQIRVCV
ncbi:hypothetical protein MOQ_008213 [Trypanosoma cruzi marinkellei]|uniref:Guanine nucleotide-binding protein subunit beta-like protein n=1 Tax=Trypanosoma cruzi marinkellei TaxID=85056 RepID=K2N0E3_TRYCR|nr:hypothetical protein MOQ_008213 [Trypanosoma cruzi marinkellei]